MSHIVTFVIGVVVGGAFTAIFGTLWLTATGEREDPWREP